MQQEPLIERLRQDFNEGVQAHFDRNEYQRLMTFMPSLPNGTAPPFSLQKEKKNMGNFKRKKIGEKSF